MELEMLSMFKITAIVFWGVFVARIHDARVYTDFNFIYL